jgi:hypothetical protein
MTTQTPVQIARTPRNILRDNMRDYVPTPVRQAQEVWARFRADNGFARLSPPLLTAPTHNMKLDKTQAYGLSLAPARLSGYNTCKHSTIACRRVCLNTAGKGAYNSVQRARIVKTKFLHEYTGEFSTLLMHEVHSLYMRYGKDLRMRLNVLSDLRWEELLPQVFECAPRARFYDYTKDWDRMFIDMPDNYTLAASAHERTTEQDVQFMVDSGHDVSVVFSTPAGQPLPHTYAGQHVTDADLSDAWMLMRPRSDGRGRVGGLRAKGRARGDISGFVKNPLGS